MRTIGKQRVMGWPRAAIDAARCATPEPFMEHRWGIRIPCEARVAVTTLSGSKGTGRLRNVSLSGAFLETPQPLALFSLVAVAALRADGTRFGAEFMATVVRHAPGGVGIEWSEAVSGPICRVLGCAAQCKAPGIQRS